MPFLPYSLLSCLGSLTTGALAMVGGLGVVGLLATEASDARAGLLLHLLLMLASLGAALGGLLGLVAVPGGHCWWPFLVANPEASP